jgi:hypothetical protein
LADGTRVVGTEHPDTLATRTTLVLVYRLLRPTTDA